MLTTILTSTLVFSSSPQVPLSGAFMNAPVVVTSKSSTQAPMDLLLANPSAAAQPLYNADSRFTRAALFGSPTPGVAFGSFSSGGAFISAAMNFSHSPARACSDPTDNNMWSFQIFSVTPTTKGDFGSIYDLEGSTVGGAIFSYIVPNSSGFPPQFIGTVEKIRDAGQMGVDDVVGIDTYINALLLGAVPSTGPVKLFFTVTPGTIDSIPDAWVDDDDALKLPSTIFEVQYSTGSGWGSVEMFKTSEELGLSPGAEIDALCVDTSNGRILLSTAAHDLDEQLWLVWDAHSYTGPYWNPTGSEIYVKSELGFLDKDADGIDGLCADDPKDELAVTTDRQAWRQQSSALPRFAVNFTPNAYLRGSAHREWASSTTEYYRATLTHHCSGSEPDGLATLMLTDATGQYPLASYMRNNSQTVDMIMHVAPSPTTPVLLNLHFTVQWVVALQSGDECVTHKFEFFR